MVYIIIIFAKVYVEYVKKINDRNTRVQMVNTVAENRSNYTTQQFERAKEARKFYHNIGASTIENFKYILNGNMIRNCPLTIEDVEIA